MTRPLRIVVVGNSVSVMTAPARLRRGEGTYGEVLVDRLAADGIPAELYLEGRWFDFAPAALRGYDERIRRHSPDVLVLHYGLNESQPWLVPIWLLRHLLREHTTTRPVGIWYRRAVAAPLWRSVRAWRRVAARLVGTHTWQVTPARFAGTVERIVRAVRRQLRPLVLVLDVNPPGARLEHFLPGQAARHAVVQRTLADVVASFDDPEVRLVPVSQVVAALGHDVAVPDDIHYSAVGHAKVAEMLHDEISAWLAGPDQVGRARPG